MLGNPSHKELERHTICLHVINSSMKGWLGGGHGAGNGKARILPGGFQIREGIFVKEMLTSRRTRRSSPSRHGG